jgi:putative zinc finger protein
MLSCAEFLAEFGDYLEEAASPEVRAHLEEHLRECKTCQVIVDSTRKTIRIVTDSDSFTLSAGSSGAHRSRRHGPNPRKEAVAPAKDCPPKSSPESCKSWSRRSLRPTVGHL